MRSFALICLALSWLANPVSAQYPEREKLPAPQRISRWNLSSAAVCIQPAPDQREVAVALESGEVQIWPVTAKAARLKLGAKGVLSLAWSPDGKSLAWSQRDGAVVVVNRETGERRELLPPSKAPTVAVLFLLDRVTLACGQGKQLRLVDLESGKVFCEADAPNAIRRLEYDHDGSRIIALTNPPGFAAYHIAQQAWEKTAARAAEHVCYNHFNIGICRMDFLLPGTRAQSYVTAFGEISYHFPVDSLSDKSSTYAAAPHTDLLAVIKGGQVRLLDTAEYNEILKFSTGLVQIDLAQFNPSGTLLALAAQTELQVWKIPTYSELPISVLRPNGLRYVKDSQTLVCLGESTIMAWDCPTRACIAALPRTGNRAAFSEHGTRLAVSSGEFTDLWDLETFLPIGRLKWDETITPLDLRRGLFPKPSKQDPLTPANTTNRYPVSMAISPDDQTLAISRGDGSLQIWQVRTLKKLADWIKTPTLFRAGKPLAELAYSPDGKSLAGIESLGGIVNFNRHKLRVFDVATQKKAPECSFTGSGIPWFNWAADSASLVFTVQRDTPDRQICLIRVDPQTGREVEELLPNAPIWYGTTLGPLFVTHNEQSLIVYDLDTKKNIVQTQQIGNTSTGGAALGPSRDLLAVGGMYGVSFIKVPRVAIPAVPRAVELAWKPQTSHANALAWLSERTFVTALEDGQVLWWDIDKRSEQAQLKTRADTLSSMAATADGQFLLIAGTRNDHGWLEVVDLIKRESVVEHSIDHASIVSLAVDREGAVAWGTDEGELALWDLPQRKLRWSQQVADDGVRNVAFQPAGKLLAVGQAKSGSATVLLLDVATGDVHNTISLTQGTKLGALAWSPNGQQLAIASSTGLQRYDARTKKTIDIPGVTGVIRCVAWSSEDDLVVATADQKLQMLDLRTGSLRLIASHRQRFESLAIATSRQQCLTLDAASGIQLRNLNESPPTVRPAQPAGPGER